MPASRIISDSDSDAPVASVSSRNDVDSQGIESDSSNLNLSENENKQLSKSQKSTTGNTKRGQKRNVVNEDSSNKKTKRTAEAITSEKRKNAGGKGTRTAASKRRKAKNVEVSKSDDDESEVKKEKETESSDDLSSVSDDIITEFKPGQTKATPSPGYGDRVFYESLFEQNPNSFMALKWCVEYGVFPLKKSEAMLKKLLMRKEEMKLNKK